MVDKRIKSTYIGFVKVHKVYKLDSMIIKNNLLVGTKEVSTKGYPITNVVSMVHLKS